MKWTKLVTIAGAALLVLATSPVLAKPGNGNGWGGGYGGGRGHGAPGPLAAAGLPFLLIAGTSGAYRLIRRRRDERRQMHEAATQH